MFNPQRNLVLALSIFVAVAISAGILTGQDEEPDFWEIYMDNPNDANFNKAVAYYQNLLKEDPLDDQARLLLSYLFIFELDRTIEPFEDNLDSLSAGMKFQYGNLLLSLGQYKEAIKIYDILNQELPKWSCPWRHKGEAYFKWGKLDEAQEALQMAITTRVTHYDAYVMLANVEKTAGKYQQALETLKTGLSYYGKDIEDPEEEVPAVDVKFLHLELLKLNNLQKEYQDLAEELKKTAPDDPRWDNFNESN